MPTFSPLLLENFQSFLDMKSWNMWINIFRKYKSHCHSSFCHSLLSVDTIITEIRNDLIHLIWCRIIDLKITRKSYPRAQWSDLGSGYVRTFDLNQIWSGQVSAQELYAALQQWLRHVTLRQLSMSHVSVL